MKIRLYPPFHILGGELIEFPLERELTLDEFSRLLVNRFPKLLDFLPSKNETVELLGNVFFVANKGKNGKILSPSDVVRDEDFLEIMGPVEGG